MRAESTAAASPLAASAPERPPRSELTQHPAGALQRDGGSARGMDEVPAASSSSATRPNSERRFQLVAARCRREFKLEPLSETAVLLARGKCGRHGRTVRTALGAGVPYERGVEGFKRITGA